MAGAGPESGIVRRGRLGVGLAGGRWRMSDKSKCSKVSTAKAVGARARAAPDREEGHSVDGEGGLWVALTVTG